MRTIAIAISAVMAATALVGCGVPDDDVFTLYRTGAVTVPMRIHVATFDAADGAAYNSENCNHAMQLLQSQPHLEVRFWCEKGRYRK